MKKSRRPVSASAVGLLEEVFHTAGSLPISAWAVYFAVTFPFVLAFLYFWADMASHAFAHERLAIGATVLSILYVVLKTGHSLFARQVLAHLTDDLGAPRPRVLRIAVNQTILQSTGFLTLPLCLLMLAPFGWSYAFYQNATVLDDGRKPMSEVLREARAQAGLNPMQNHVMLWLLCPYIIGIAAVFFFMLLPIMRVVSPEWTDTIMAIYAVVIGFLLIPLSPFGMAVAVNLGVALVVLPQLLRMFFGIQTAFTISPMSVMSPTFVVVVTGMTYLCLDPLIKIAYSIRCFYGSAIHTGRDLRIKLERLAGASIGIFLLASVVSAFSPSGVHAQEIVSSVGERAEALDEAIESTLQDRKFAWRFPRQRPEGAETGIFASIAGVTNDIVERAIDIARDFWKWLRDLFPRRDSSSASPRGAVPEKVLRSAVYVLLVFLIGILAYVGWRTWRRSTVVEMTPVAVEPALPDLEDEGTTADELPSNEWFRLAQELMEKGEIRLAMRAYFFGGLARLAQLRLIRLAPHKSNREYGRELQRIAHAEAELVNLFSANLRIFESVWYGDHTLAAAGLRRYAQIQEQIGHHA